MSHALKRDEVEQLYQVACQQKNLSLFKPKMGKAYQEIISTNHIGKVTRNHQILTRKCQEIMELANTVKPCHLRKNWWNNLTGRQFKSSLKIQFVSKKIPQLLQHCHQILDDLQKNDPYRGEYTFDYQEAFLSENIEMLKAFLDIAEHHEGGELRQQIVDWTALKINLEMTKAQIKLTKSQFDDIRLTVNRLEILSKNYQAFVASYLHQEISNNDEMTRQFNSMFEVVR